jgi:hypothetical protein
MKCCLCHNVKIEFLLNTDLCLCCSKKLEESRTKSVRKGYKPVSLLLADLKDKYPKGNHYIYKYSDGENVLYVGQTSDLIARTTIHLLESKFNYRVSHMEIIEYNSELSKFIDELWWISLYEPEYNKFIPKGESTYESPYLWCNPVDINTKIKEITYEKR